MFHAKQIGKNNQFLEMESCLPGLHCYTSIFPVLRKHPLGPPRYIHLRGEVREVFVWCQCTLLCHGHDFAKAFLFVLWWEADGKEARKIWLYINVYNLWFYEYILLYIWLFPFNPCPEGKVWLEVWFGGMIRGYDSGYDSRVWFAAPKTFISALAGNWALSLSFTGPAHYQLN